MGMEVGVGGAAEAGNRWKERKKNCGGIFLNVYGGDNLESGEL